MNFLVYALGMFGFFVCGFALMCGGMNGTAIGGPATLGGIPTLNHMFTVGSSVNGDHGWGLFGTAGFFLTGGAYDSAAIVLFLFMMVFMDTTATIVTGACAERWSLKSFFAFSIIIGGFIYPIFGNWVWGGGWLAQLGYRLGLGHGAVDYAGSGVVHAMGGVAAFWGAKRLGPRIGKFAEDGTPRAGAWPLVKDIESHLLPSVRLFVCDENGEETVAGTRLTASYFGGQPTLPASAIWPASDEGDKIAGSDRLVEAGGRPLAFLGQVSLREMQALAPMPGWPKEGILDFFYCIEDFGPCRILFLPEGGPLERTDYPEQLEEEDRFPPRGLTARPEWTLEKHLRRKSDGAELVNQKEYLELLERLNSDGPDATRPVHRFGGHAQEIQNPLRLECQLLTRSIHSGNSERSKDSLAVEPSDADADWQLVMQFDSEFDHLDWEWDDGGRVYFMARRQDIEAGDFSNCWAVLQCD